MLVGAVMTENLPLNRLYTELDQILIVYWESPKQSGSFTNDFQSSVKVWGHNAAWGRVVLAIPGSPWQCCEDPGPHLVMLGGCLHECNWLCSGNHVVPWMKLGSGACQARTFSSALCLWCPGFDPHHWKKSRIMVLQLLFLCVCICFEIWGCVVEGWCSPLEGSTRSDGWPTWPRDPMCKACTLTL